VGKGKWSKKVREKSTKINKNKQPYWRGAWVAMNTLELSVYFLHFSAIFSVFFFFVFVFPSFFPPQK
jgi:hypothetical protein